jgi:hypothetical protein
MERAGFLMVLLKRKAMVDARITCFFLALWRLRGLLPQQKPA